MKIKIVTTEPRLTKQLISQMRQATIDVMKNGDVLGYLINAVQGCHRVVLVEHGGEYFIVHCDWQKWPRSVSRRSGGRFTQSQKFGSTEDVADWWAAYKAVTAKATKQIYV